MFIHLIYLSKCFDTKSNYFYVPPNFTFKLVKFCRLCVNNIILVIIFCIFRKDREMNVKYGDKYSTRNESYSYGKNDGTYIRW